MHWIDASAAQLGFSRLQRQDLANAKHYVSRLVDVLVSITNRLGKWRPIADGLLHAKARGNL